MENVAKINYFIFAKKELCRGFENQKNKIVCGNLSLNPKYDTIIKETINWYEELSSIRHTFIHFIVGICVSGKDEENKTRLVYLTYNLSNVKSDDKKAKIVRNIIEDVEFFYQKTMNFLNDISTIYLEKIDPKTVSYVY